MGGNSSLGRGDKKPSLIKSYLLGLIDTRSSERYSTLLKYFIPECITAFVLYSIVNLVDSWFIADLKSTAAYATLGVANTLLHAITKVAEGVGVGTVIVCGYYNARKDEQGLKAAAFNATLVAMGLGFCVALLLYVSAPWLYNLQGISHKMAVLGIPFLRVRAVASALMFIVFALIGFLRSIKNTRIPMVAFVTGAVVFLTSDYLLIYGKYGLPALGLYGSALSSLLQYSSMLLLLVVYFIIRRLKRRSGWALPAVQPALIKKLLNISWPVVIDKAVLAGAKYWIVRMLLPLGKTALASFTLVRDIEQFAFAPAIAFAQVITLLVSNDVGLRRWHAVTNNIKKVLTLATVSVGLLLCICVCKPTLLIALFDRKAAFTVFASTALPIMSVLAFFDVWQLILAGSLRGACDVRTVMLTRVCVFGGLVVPASWFIAHIPGLTDLVRFIAIYATFYCGDGIMSIIYIRRLRSGAWKQMSR